MKMMYGDADVKLMQTTPMAYKGRIMAPPVVHAMIKTRGPNTLCKNVY